MKKATRRYAGMAAYGAVAILLMSTGCMRYLTHDRSEVLLDGVDIDQTLQIAEAELREGGTGSVLTIWAIRDQFVTPLQAQRISDLYFGYVDSLRGKFDTWHLTWAIANLYRQGDEGVRGALQAAYDDARVRARNTHRLADRFANGDTLYLGDAHSGGRAYAKRHVVIPGSKKYVNSFDDYVRRKEKRAFRGADGGGSKGRQ
jgi:hypothetical protein